MPLEEYLPISCIYIYGKEKPLNFSNLVLISILRIVLH
jgi:hypothetical protein